MLVPKVGVGVIVWRDSKILLGKRKGAHGAGTYAFTGGHLEAGESIFECAKRETLEEAGIEIEDLRFLCVINTLAYAPKHYVDIGVTARWKSGELTIMEPDKVESWDWYDPQHLPAPLFHVVPNYMQALADPDKTFFDL
jgi:8-oxo-dGTP diphosphatase